MFTLWTSVWRITLIIDAITSRIDAITPRIDAIPAIIDAIRQSRGADECAALSISPSTSKIKGKMTYFIKTQTSSKLVLMKIGH
ncbi:hypothetical protein WQ57_05910 [Mesobacillus campisalis]|uniref:Uncharacterized protein n=1 Tax=Mesobacillus campisalis TaxID=1408103 RepID=A0A0M2SXJ5_9BACI|nr:hypothetical protein WQ57_05910 [Mesobacillus campisalis]